MPKYVLPKKSDMFPYSYRMSDPMRNKILAGKSFSLFLSLTRGADFSDFYHSREERISVTVLFLPDYGKEEDESSSDDDLRTTISAPARYTYTHECPTFRSRRI